MDDQTAREIHEEHENSSALLFVGLLLVVAFIGFLFWYALSREDANTDTTNTPGVNLDINLPPGSTSTNSY